VQSIELSPRTDRQEDSPPHAPRETSFRLKSTLLQLEELTAMLESIDAVPDPTSHRGVPDDVLVSIVVPVFNEERTIVQVVERVLALPVAKEVIVVDDGSSDGTLAALSQLEDRPELRIVAKPVNEGKGAALRTGFGLATGAIVAVQDADLEYDPTDLLPLLKPIFSGEADVVYGSRFLERASQDRSWVHRTGNAVLTLVSNLTTGLRLTDMETCHKVFRREVLKTVSIEQNRFGFEPEVTAKLARRKFRIVEKPISYTARGYADGKKIGIRDLFNAIYCIVRYGLRD
jgi:glycosyltransferase involved in cell wall biosynthesis